MACRIATAIPTGSSAHAIPVFKSTPSAPNSMAMVTSLAVPTPASTMIGTLARSRMIRILFGFNTPWPDPMGAAAGITDYFDTVHAHHFPGANVTREQRIHAVYELFADHETRAARPVEDYLRAREDIHMAGQGADPDRERVGVMSFFAKDRDSGEIVRRLQAAKIGVYADDFYAARCIDALGARQRGGVIRPSLAHYNSTEDVTRLLDQLDKIL